MKNPRLFLLSLAALSLMTSASVFADGKALCEKYIGDYHDAHCTYVTGLPSNSEKGRYIKHYDSNFHFSYTRCVTATTVEDDIYQDIAEMFVGARNIQYSICTDASGEQCEPVGTDTYNITKSGENYIGTPAIYALDLSAVTSKYPECDGFVMSLKHTLTRPFIAKR